jgi:hypothetical protein
VSLSDRVVVLPEPPLEFRHKQRVEDPRIGLGLFGPYDTDVSAHPKNIIYAVLGPPEGVAAFEGFARAMAGPILVRPEEVSGSEQLWRPFPGFDAAFHSEWPKQAAWTFTIDRNSLLQASRHRDPNQRAYDVVNHYMRGIETAQKRDDNFNVLICIVPDEIYQNCRPQSRVSKPTGERLSTQDRKHRRGGQFDLLSSYNPVQYEMSVDFRRQLKARAMAHGIPVQILLESTLRLGLRESPSERGLTPLADRAWNLGTTLYYKAGGKPWRLSTAREGVCYIGVAFRRTDFAVKGQTACCAAQMFLDTGDGVVFLGEYGPWYSPERKQFHLSREAAKSLLSGVLETYNQLEGKPLTEIFLHYRSNINEEEFEGYRAACPPGTKIVGVRVRSEDDGVKLFRPGTRPVLRGTFWQVNERTGFLWGSGFKPALRTYDGWEVPTPLRIDVQYGDADVEQVAADILGLTKLNYNSCKLGDSEPVTVKFSDAVGEILVANPTVEGTKPNFKYYI